MSKYATFDIQMCFQCDAIVPDSHASSYAPSRSQAFLIPSDLVSTNHDGEAVSPHELCPEIFKKEEESFKEPHNKKWGKEANKQKKRKLLIILEV